MILLDTRAEYDPSATKPALAIVPVLTTPATPTPATPTPTTPTPTPTRAPQRQRLPLTRRLVPPAPVTVPLGALLPAQDAFWRARAVQLAWEHDYACAATFIGQSARHADNYRVPSATTARFYRVSFIPFPQAQTIADGRWVCECQAARQGYPCHHVGAAFLVANRRAIVAESVALAQQQRIGWAWATPHGGNVEAGVAIYRVAHPAGRRWDYVQVAWDIRNDEAVYCECGASGACAHVGAVAMRVANDREYMRRRAQHRLN